MAKPINYIYIPVAELYMEVSNTAPEDTREWILGVLTAVIKQEWPTYSTKACDDWEDRYKEPKDEV